VFFFLFFYLRRRKCQGESAWNEKAKIRGQKQEEVRSESLKWQGRARAWR
jgi:hypothetical protein